jgi:Histone methylation protein DOT1
MPKRRSTKKSPPSAAAMKKRKVDSVVTVSVTPSSEEQRRSKKTQSKQEDNAYEDDAAIGRRVLFDAASSTSPTGINNYYRRAIAAAITPSKTPSDDVIANEDDVSSTVSFSSLASPSAKRRLVFGRYVDAKATIPTQVTRVYKIVHKLTGSIGGNGYSGPIYGELTCHSMQKVINKMIETTNFSATSRFIDVGSGIGKPNLHVAQYPGVALSVGVEMEYTRWTLGLTCLKAVLDEAVQDEQTQQQERTATVLKGNTMFLHKNMLEASTFDPFTHVYMFSIGFPPELWLDLATMWNDSSKTQCLYLVCYHGPRDIIHEYGFNVELITQLSTSMHGSKEGHMAYIYKRSVDDDDDETEQNAEEEEEKKDSEEIAIVNGVPCDALFEESFHFIGQNDTKILQEEVSRQVTQIMDTGRSTRSRKNVRTEFSRSYY